MNSEAIILEKVSSWNYIKIPSYDLNKNVLKFNKDKLKELIPILKKAELEL
ncbi:hypothetical protein [Chryseobacterium sp.]|uniref:hypothetical protein n=1 Tax=unclassified Chryseobacterium TaxID=2593645 RepID=UPI0028973687|nr:hypothetical protein [Chryseobacterium sp.]